MKVSRALGILIQSCGILFLGGACSTMRPVPEPTRYIESVRPKLVRITDTDGQQYLMVGARLQHDTVMGFVQDPATPIGEFRELPMKNVAKLEAQQYVHTRTALAVFGAFAAWAALTYAVVRHEDTEGGQCSSSPC